MENLKIKKGDTVLQVDLESLKRLSKTKLREVARDLLECWFDSVNINSWIEDIGECDDYEYTEEEVLELLHKVVK